ncbi:hypothetical protein [Candidatus Avelusimicrobium faecicola]|uniref:hypothetical protein n=1 Tax=Candidatus Avelusimicrobium faecicola TaxID=3416205 RepID=UPI003D0B0B80
MRLFEKIKLHTMDSTKSRVILVLGKPLVYYQREHFFKSFTFAWNLPVKNTSIPVFYLKVNRLADYTLPCIQHWINIINNTGADFYFLCDNKKLQNEILRWICFPNRNVKFISSWRKKLKKIIFNIGTKNWIKATAAHLTSFYHAKQQKITKFWTIDADDTMICQYPEKGAKFLQQVELYAEKHNVAACSLDMWRSRTKGKHWSFGVCYVRDMVDFCSIFDRNEDLSWISNYLKLDTAFNLDWFFTYLKEKKNIKIESFYFSNCYFIHWGSFIFNPIGASVYYWENGKLCLPVLAEVFQKKDLGVFKIADCFKVDIGKPLSASLDFLLNEATNFHRFGPEHWKLHSLEKIANKSKMRY